MKYKKTIVFINLRFSDFYSQDLFKRVKEEKQVRLVAIIDQQFKNKIGAYVKPHLDKIVYLPSDAKKGFLGEFCYDNLRFLIEKEMQDAEEIKIVCSDEFNLLNAGRLRREMNIAGHSDHYLAFYRDKEKMKTLLAKGGVRVPKFKMMHQDGEFDNWVDEISLPFVIKPIDSCGSHGIYIIRNKDEFEQVNYIINEEYQSYEIEEFIEGKLYHVDSCIKDNNLTFICASEYTWPNFNYTKGQPLGSIPLNKNDQLSMRLIDFAKKCLGILKANNIVNHMELFVTKNDEIIFLEVSGRPPGALINLTHYLNFGFNLMDEDFFMQSNINLNMNTLPANESVFFALFPLRPGKVIKLNPPNVKSRIDIKWHVSVGDVININDCNNIVGKSAQAIFYHADKKILRDDFEKIKQHTALEVV